MVHHLARLHVENFFKRNLFTGVEFPYGKFSEDLFTIYKTILKSENVTYVGFDGYFYYLSR